MAISENNKRIAKNTLFLYVRMLLIMGVNLYTVRAVLNLLGVVDYGIYNVVGGVVTLFSFISGTLTTSSQRYFSIELARENIKALQKIFCLNVTVFAIIILGIIILAETVGLWFVNVQMTIPENRLLAANIVYQFSILAFSFQMFSIPYNALIVAHEKMGAFAYIGIIEVILKLVVVFTLTITGSDKLILYGILMSLMALLITNIYRVYCRTHFVESKFFFYWNRTEATELMSFSGWHFLGTMAVVVRGQGINLLINLFFNPAINAARAIAFQIDAAVGQLSNNFFVAVKPQIYKYYSKGELVELHNLILRSTIMCFFLVSLLVFPVIFNTSFILHIWLKNVPDYCIIFTQLVLVNSLIDSTSGPTIAPALATGRIKKYELIIAFLIGLNLPISYLLLKFGEKPEITVIVSIVLSVITALSRAFLLKNMIKMPVRKYFKLFTKLILVSLISFSILQYVFIDMEDSWLKLIVMSFSSTLLLLLIYYFIIIDSINRERIINFVKTKIN
jgi:O-antigen/teichoic acid export membrane protein